MKHLTKGFVLATSLLALTGYAQATCIHSDPGWHRVPITCKFQPAINWQTYDSGHYIQPVTDSALAMWPNKVVQ